MTSEQKHEFSTCQGSAHEGGITSLFTILLFATKEYVTLTLGEAVLTPKSAVDNGFEFEAINQMLLIECKG